MEYIESLGTQTGNFLFSLGFGLIVGILYDVVRTVRLVFTDSKKALYATDFLFAVFSALATFLFCLTVTDGKIRWYIILGEAIGFSVYYFSFGVIAVRFTDKTVGFIKKFSKKLFFVISSPFIKLFSFFKRKIGKIVEKTRKNTRKAVKKSKFHLQTDKALLYNLTNRMQKLCEKNKKTKEKQKNDDL